MQIKLNALFVPLVSTPVMTLHANDVLLELIHLTREQPFALNVVVDQKPIPIALPVNSVKLDFSLLMTDNVKPAQKIKFLIQKEAVNATHVELVLNQMKIPLDALTAQLVNSPQPMELVNYVQ